MIVDIKKLHEDVQIPTSGTEKAAGKDVYAYIPNGDVIIEPHHTELIPTGFCMAFEFPNAALLLPRSGISVKKGLNLANCVGLIDADYRGEVKVALHNITDEPQTVSHGERIAQLMYIRCRDVVFSEVDELDETERGEGGFGSTGEK